MRINITKCDHCQKDIKTENSEINLLGMQPFLDTRRDGINISLHAGGEQSHASYYRDFCNEECLRDFLVDKLPVKTTTP